MAPRLQFAHACIMQTHAVIQLFFFELILFSHQAAGPTKPPPPQISHPVSQFQWAQQSNQLHSFLCANSSED